MEQKVAAFINKGMRQDYSPSKAPNEFAFENYNIRITTRGENSALSVTNEKNPKAIKIVLFGTGEVDYLNGTTLGYAVLNNSFVLFTKDTSTNLDYIYKVVKQDDIYTAYELYRGNLSFNIDNKIETLVSYESEEVQKVYWVDGVNMPRVINVANTDGLNYSDNSFDFFPDVNTDITINITKNYAVSYFPAGTIQYVFTYYNKFGVETAPIYTSPLYYMSFKDRGGKPDETVNSVFNINIKDYDNTYDYLRVYSLQRSSLNGDVVGHIVIDFNIKDSNIELNYIDNGANQTVVDATSLLFSNSSILIPSTIAQKDNVLFLGDIKTKDTKEVFNEIKRNIKSIGSYPGVVQFKTRIVEHNDNIKEVYSYSPNLDISSKDIKTFKCGETYRLAIQLQDKKGIWSQAIWLGDFKNYRQIQHKQRENGESYYEVPTITIDGTIFKNNFETLLKEADYVKYRLMMAEITNVDREILAQGFVSPTVFNIEERINGSVHAESSWFPRFVNKDYHYQNVNTVVTPGESYKDDPDVSVDVLKFEVNTYGTDYAKKNYLNNILETPFYETVSQDLDPGEVIIESNYFTITIVPAKFVLSFTINLLQNVNGTVKTIPISFPNSNYSVPFNPPWDVMVFMPHMVHLRNKNLSNFSLYNVEENKTEYLKDVIEKYLAQNNLYIKDSRVYDEKLFSSLTAQDINNVWYYGGSFNYYFNNDVNNVEGEVSNINKSGYFIDASLFDFYSPDIDNIQSDNQNYKLRIIGYTPLKNTLSDFSLNVENAENGKKTSFNFVNNVINQYNGLKSYPLFMNEGKTYIMSTWNKGGSIIHQQDDKTTSHTLKSKKIANLWYCDNTVYSFAATTTGGTLWEPNLGIQTIKIHNDDTPLLDISNTTYKGNYSSLLVNTKEEDKIKKYDILYVPGLIDSIDPIFIDDYVNISTVNIEQGNIRDSVSIKYNSSKHAVINLNSKNVNSILPNYGYPKNFNNNVNLITNSKISLKDVKLAGLLIGNDIKINGKYSSTSKFYLGKFPVGSYVIFCTSHASVPSAIANIVDYNVYNSTSDILQYTSDGFKYVYALVLEDYGYAIDFKIIDIFDSVNDVLNHFEFEIFGELESNNSYTYRYLSSYNTNIKTYDGIYYNIDVLYLPGKSDAYNNGTYEGSGYYSEIEETNPYLWVAEIYRDVPNKFGGTSENAIENNVFIPISEPFNLFEDIIATEGDTYYQRWDCLRIYPTTEEDTNSVIDIVSLPLESYTNLDGRSDVNRKRLDLVNARPTNTNLFNDVYNQSNNFFTSAVLDEKFNTSVYSNAYTWSLKKTNNANVDNWTKGLMVNVETLDGSKGKLNKLLLWNDYLLAFQDKGIARINYNNQSIISTQQGVPLEIANSGRVNGHTYISTASGCRNKWSIAESVAGLYFVDSDNKSLNLFNGQLVSISNNNGFRDWFANNIEINDNSIGSYDSIHNDYYLTNTNSLCLSEELQSFSSFYDYDYPMFTFNDRFIGIDSKEHTSLLELFEGNNYATSYYMTYLVNPEPISDKTFNIIEYRADVKDNNNKLLKDITFDTMTVENEYQSGTCYPKNSNKYPIFNGSAKKFRIWRVPFPRDTSNGRDRIRNPWVKLTLSKTDSTQPYKMEFHDLLVKYFS